MSVMIGSARSDEKNGARGGQAGDQKSGKEVSTQTWYKCTTGTGGWRVFRCIDPAKAEKMAWCMQAACDNNAIGYDQGQRLTLHTEAQKFDFDCSKITKPVETDCSSLTRTCAAYAGIKLANYTTSTEPNILLKSGMFVELTGTKYRQKSDYLRRGDILVTPKQGHTVIVLSDGPKAEKNVPVPNKGLTLGMRELSNGCSGADVVELQKALISLGYSCGDDGPDGDYGDNTEIAVTRMQADAGLEQDGEFGPLSYEALQKMLARAPVPEDKAKSVKIVGGDCFARSAPNTTGEKLGVCYRNHIFTYGGQTYENGWLLIQYGNMNAWVSPKYAQLIG